jgi:hypothetical protein
MDTNKPLPLTMYSKFSELQKLGAKQIGDIPLEELLAYLRREFLALAADERADKDYGWASDWAAGAEAIQLAIDSQEKALDKLNSDREEAEEELQAEVRPEEIRRILEGPTQS